MPRGRHRRPGLAAPKVPAMIRRSYALRMMALCAAYVVALQALLLPLSVAFGGSLDLTPCSVSTSAGGSHTPASHQTGCPCAAGCGMQCGVHVLNAPPAVAFAVLNVRVSAMTPVPEIEAVVRPADRRLPQIPRAPPAAA